MGVKTVISIQTPGSSGKYEQFFRIECDDSRVETLRRALTEWAKKPSDFLIGSKRPKPSYHRARALKKAEEAQSDDHIIPGVEATVERAFAE